MMADDTTARPGPKFRVCVTPTFLGKQAVWCVTCNTWEHCEVGGWVGTYWKTSFGMSTMATFDWSNLLERQPVWQIDGQGLSRDLFSLISKVSVLGWMSLRKPMTRPFWMFRDLLPCTTLFTVLRHQRSSDGKWVALPWKRKKEKEKKCSGSEPSVPKILQNMS